MLRRAGYILRDGLSGSSAMAGAEPDIPQFLRLDLYLSRTSGLHRVPFRRLADPVLSQYSGRRGYPFAGCDGLFRMLRIGCPTYFPENHSLCIDHTFRCSDGCVFHVFVDTSVVFCLCGRRIVVRPDGCVSSTAKGRACRAGSPARGGIIFRLRIRLNPHNSSHSRGGNKARLFLRPVAMVVGQADVCHSILPCVAALLV